MEGVAPSTGFRRCVDRRPATACSVTLKGSVPVGVFLRELGAEVAGGGVDVDLALGQAAFKLGVAGLDVVRRVAGDNDDEVGVGSAGQFAHLGGGLGKALGQPLEVVDELGALLLIEERMVVFALLAAQFADVGNAQCHDGQRRIDLQRGQCLVGKRRRARRSVRAGAGRACRCRTGAWSRRR